MGAPENGADQRSPLALPLRLPLPLPPPPSLLQPPL